MGYGARAGTHLTPLTLTLTVHARRVAEHTKERRLGMSYTYAYDTVPVAPKVYSVDAYRVVCTADAGLEQ